VEQSLMTTATLRTESLFMKCCIRFSTWFLSRLGPINFSSFYSTKIVIYFPYRRKILKRGGFSRSAHQMIFCNTNLGATGIEWKKRTSNKTVLKPCDMDIITRDRRTAQEGFMRHLLFRDGSNFHPKQGGFRGSGRGGCINYCSE
jgi:hypothetical protein